MKRGQAKMLALLDCLTFLKIPLGMPKTIEIKKIDKINGTRLAKLIRASRPDILLNKHYDGDGDVVFQHA
jgi:hypothetical protein